MRLCTTLWNINVWKTNDNNKHLGKMKKDFRPTLRWMIRMTLDCVKSTQSSVIQIIHRNICLECFCFHLLNCLSVVIVIYWYFIYISQGRVRQWKNFENRPIRGKDMDKNNVFYGPPCMIFDQQWWWFESLMMRCWNRDQRLQRLDYLSNPPQTFHEMYFFFPTFYTVSQKKACDYIFGNNWNNECPIIIIFGTLINETICHRMVVLFPTSSI